MSEKSLVEALLRPRAVGLLGASGDPNKNTGRPQRFLAKHGFNGTIVPVNPGRSEVQGLRAYPHLADAGEPVDHAFVMVPNDAVEDAIEDCAAAGCKVATIYTDGFAETGEDGRRRQEALVARARELGLRILGPNSMGVISPASAMPLSVNAVLEQDVLPKGRIGLISQSGTILGTLLSRGTARGIGFSHMLSLGNEADLGLGELVDVLVDDPDTDAIVLFIEAIRDAVSLARAARRAYEAGKPIIAYKLGRSDVGKRLAVSHSGALAGEDKATDAFFRAHGIIRVDMLETLFELPLLAIGRRPPEGQRVAVVTTTGGGAASVADRLGAAGLELVSPPKSVRQAMAEHGLSLGHGPIVDLTMAGTRKGVYGAALAALLDSPECDGIVCVVGSSGQFHPELAVEPILGAKGAKKPVAAFIVPQADASLRLLAENGLAAFRTPEAAADGLAAFFRWRAPVEAPASPTADLAHPKVATPMDEALALAFFDALGVPVPAHQVLQPGETACDLPFPVALKVLSPDLAHKTEAGGVRLRLADQAALDRAAAEIVDGVKAHAPDARVRGLLAESMESGLGEVLAGFRRDPILGPLVVLSPGGILAEVYGDAAIRIAPIDHRQAHEMIAEVKGLAPLRGYRGLPEGDLAALADVLVRLSDLARDDAPTVAEAEINPLIVRAKGRGVVAVDGLVVP